MAENNSGVPWRSVVDWGVRLVLVLMVYFLTGIRTDMHDLTKDVMTLRIDMAAVVQANITQAVDIMGTRSTDVALMNLLNEVTTNVAMLTERVNQVQLRVDRLEP